MIPYTAPTFLGTAFNCAICNAFSKQIWFDACINQNAYARAINGIEFSHCTHCNKYSIWVKGKLIYPQKTTAPLPNQDMPEEIQIDYLEAGNILHQSPRGAAALLRLALEKLCVHLKANGNDINEKIADLVKKGIPESVQMALDSVRVIGNNAVHPGQINLKDDLETATKLFVFINIICQILITTPNSIKEVYNGLPESKIKGIEKRDSK